MQHISIPLENTVELLNVTPINSLISRCEIKVCYVSDKPNRNGSIITKDTAIKMAATLPGCPIVGFYDEQKEDFTGHQRTIEVGDGNFKIKDITKAYGYVDSSAKIWFQKFMDDGVEHEYLMTEGNLWTSIYEEAKKIVEQGRGQSMELDEKHMEGSWAYDENGWPSFFIINEAMIEKLCILGEDVEPCFEGAGIAVHFSLDQDFKDKICSQIEEMKNFLGKGGISPMDEKDTKIIDPEVDTEYKKKDKDDEEENKSEPESKDENDKNNEPDSEENKEDNDNDDDEEKKKKAKHSLEDDAEYQSLLTKFNELVKDYDALVDEIEPLRQFKAQKDLEAKQDMIDRFYMLSDEDKQDVVNNINTYSVDDIEAKLAIICVRNKVNFNLDEDQENQPEHKKDPFVYSLDQDNDGDSVPAWIKAVRETAKSL